MGVADNRSYKDEYLFTGKHNSVLQSPSDTAKDNPSINVDPKVNATIKENPYRSNVEIEGDEIVLQPDLSALFKAVGKSHKQGGMDVLLKPDAFIFSDYDQLAVTDQEHELFELKKGGKKATDTPAEVLKRNVDLKHYNSLITNLEDPYKDDLAKKSSALMLDKYIKTLGNIAFIQENKKGFPQGVPEFAMGTAPVYDPALKQEIAENKQYAKAGGTVNNPYMQGGGRNRESQVTYPVYGPNGEIIGYVDANGKRIGNGANAGASRFYTPRGSSPGFPTISLTPEEVGPNPVAQTSGPSIRQDRYIGSRPPYPTEWTNYFDKTQKKQYDAPNWIDPKTFYATPGLIDYMKTLDRHKGVDWDMSKADDAVWGWRHQAALEQFFPNGQVPPAVTPPKTTTPPADVPKLPTPNPPFVKGNGQSPVQAPWKFTPYQKLSHLNDWMNYASVNKYGADRAHYNATYTNPSLVNPEQAVGDMRALANQQINATNVLNPILRNAQGAQAYGQLLNQVPGVRTQYDNQNAGIINQFRQYNNQIKNNETLVNSQNDMNYSRDSTTAAVNYDNMKNYLKNEALSNTMSDVSKNQKLAYSLLQQNNPAYLFNWDTGNFDPNPNRSIMDSQGGQSNDVYNQIIEGIRKLPDSDPKKWEIYEKLLRQKNILPYLQQSSNPMAKKGGTVRNPYKY